MRDGPQGGCRLGPGGSHSVRPGRCGDLGRAQLRPPRVGGGGLFVSSTRLGPSPVDPRACGTRVAMREGHATSRRPPAVTSRSVTVSGQLVPYLRAGLKREIGSRLAILQAEIETELDPKTYSAALERLQSATALFDLIGLEYRSDQPDLEVDLRRPAPLLLKALETQHRIEVQRLQDAAADGVHLPQCDVPELGALVLLIRQKTGAQSLHRLGMRRRGDG